MKPAYIFKTLAVCFLMTVTACSGNDGGEDSGTVSGDLTLSISKTVIEANGTDAVTVAVMKGETDITSQSKVYMEDPSGNTSSFKETSFSTTTEGDYVFYAYYEGVKTENITVRAFKNIPSLPADSKPEQNTGFAKRVLTIQHTGTWCQYCPYLIRGIEYYQQNYPDNRAVFVAAHNDDDLTSEASDKVTSFLGVPGFPSFSVDFTNLTQEYRKDAAKEAEFLASKIDQAASNGCKTGISVASENAGSSVVVNVKVKSANVDNCRVAVWLLEDGIVAAQTGGSSTEVHNNVLWASSSTVAYGDRIQLDADGAGQNVYRMDVSNVHDLSNCRLVVFTAVPNASGRFVVDNVVTCPLDGQTAFEYE